MTVEDIESRCAMREVAQLILHALCRNYTVESSMKHIFVIAIRSVVDIRPV